MKPHSKESIRLVKQAIKNLKDLIAQHRELSRNCPAMKAFNDKVIDNWKIEIVAYKHILQLMNVQNGKNQVATLNAEVQG